MDFDNPKVYGDTFISDGLVFGGRQSYSKGVCPFVLYLFMLVPPVVPKFSHPFLSSPVQ